MQKAISRRRFLKQATLAGGATLAGHWWLAVGADDRPLALFVGGSRMGIAEIR